MWCIALETLPETNLGSAEEHVRTVTKLSISAKSAYNVSTISSLHFRCEHRNRNGNRIPDTGCRMRIPDPGNRPSRSRHRLNFVHGYRHNASSRTETRNKRHSDQRGRSARRACHLSDTMRSISYAAMTRGLFTKRTSQTKPQVG